MECRSSNGHSLRAWSTATGRVGTHVPDQPRGRSRSGFDTDELCNVRPSDRQECLVTDSHERHPVVSGQWIGSGVPGTEWQSHSRRSQDGCRTVVNSLPEQTSPVKQFQVHADHQRLYLHTWAEPAADQEPVRIDPTARAAMAAQICPVNGLVAALDRRTGQVAWSRSIPQQMFRDSMPVGTGLLAYSATTTKAGREGVSERLQPDRTAGPSDGDTVFQKDLPTGTMETSWKLLHNGVLRVRLTGHDFDLSWNQRRELPSRASQFRSPTSPTPTLRSNCSNHDAATRCAGRLLLNLLEDLAALADSFPDGPQLLEHVVPISAAETPEPYRSLLAHEHHMTVTMEQFHQCSVDVHVIHEQFQDPLYTREIVLTRSGTQQVVQFGLVRV